MRGRRASALRFFRDPRILGLDFPETSGIIITLSHLTANFIPETSTGTAMEKSPSWSRAHDWKSCRPLKGLEGSNPSFSATANPGTATVPGFCFSLFWDARHLGLAEFSANGRFKMARIGEKVWSKRSRSFLPLLTSSAAFGSAEFAAHPRRRPEGRSLLLRQRISP